MRRGRVLETRLDLVAGLLEGFVELVAVDREGVHHLVPYGTLGRSAGDVSTDIRKQLDRIAWPPGYRYSFGGSTKNMTEAFGYAEGWGVPNRAQQAELIGLMLNPGQ